mmetsp:Transcript_7465/g.12619  ORF Transcript_7465/g.12619 Transcript_7465/m.12619 type:complete len:123 (-) Transcript_7465:1104-1472(-)
MARQKQYLVDPDHVQTSELRLTEQDAASNCTDNNPMCRICFGEQEDEESSPLISPCKCSGSMKFVHLKCLRQWLGRNENKRVAQNVTTYTWKAFHCELCKEKLEDHYTHKKSKHLIFEIQKP